jgi:hypothetical protein
LLAQALSAQRSKRQPRTNCALVEARAKVEIEVTAVVPD